jgi:hypothetical protein
MNCLTFVKGISTFRQMYPLRHLRGKPGSDCPSIQIYLYNYYNQMALSKLGAGGGSATHKEPTQAATANWNFTGTQAKLKKAATSPA